VWLATRLMAGYIASAIGVIDCTRVLWAVLKVLIVWFKEFLALYRLAYTLI
jgi:hypothetical protein